MFKFLRSQAKLFYWVIAATFILFLFLGGMTSRGCRPPGSNQYEAGVLGSVNGIKITSQEYDYTYRQLLAQMRQNAAGRELNPNQYATARETAWDMVVRNILVEQAIKEHDIKVTDQEVLDAFRNNPPPELLAAYRDQTTGQIDMNRYYADLQNPDNDWSGPEAYIRQMLPRQKLESIIASDVFVSDDEVREEFLRQTGRAVAEYIGVIYTNLDPVEPSDAEIQAWYDAHPDDYQSPPMGKCKIVRFEKKPSEADYAEVLEYLNAEVRPRIVGGEMSFEDAAVEYSEDSSAETGGDLGTFDRDRMVAPFTEAAFSLPVGEVSEPVRTKFGWHLIEVLERDVDAETGEVFQVHARHILLKVTPGIDTIETLRESAQGFRDRVNAATFVATAEAEALDLLDPQAFIEGRDIPGLPYTLAGAQWVLRAKPGEISPIQETNDFFYVILAEKKIPAGVRPLEEVKGQVRLAVQKDHNLATARDLLAPAVGEVQMGQSMAEVAAGSDKLSHAVTDTFGMNDNISDVGYGTDFNKLAIEGTVGQIIPEVETLRGLFALKPVWILPFDSAAFEARREGIRAALLNRKRGEALEAWLQERQDAAEIVDQRHALLQGV